MVDYTCEVCERVFAKKVGYDAHKRRKRPCKKEGAIEIVAPVPTPAPANEIVESVEPVEVDVQTTKPFLKWVGGKTQILDDVLALFPSEIVNYYEPFLGGGSVLLGLLEHARAGKIRVLGTVYASDLNSNLIGLYKNIQSQPDTVIAEVATIANEFNKITGTVVNRKPATHEEACTSQESYYYWIRSQFNALTREQRTTPKGSAMMLFMNKTCFRGVYREGPRGFNVPFGNYKKPSILDEDHIRRVSELIRDVVFTECSYSDALVGVTEGDFVYLDPPYAPESETSFVSYTADGFDIDNHKALFKLCNEMSAKGTKLLMSNAQVPLVTDAFPPTAYTTKIISCRRAINSKKPDATANEVLIGN
jgi:DNA adenine methylase